MNVAVVTDGAASLPVDVAQAAGITVQPIWIHLDGVDVLDDAVTSEQVLAARTVSTSGASPGEWLQTFERLLADHDAVVAITVASGLSGTYQAARLGAEGQPRVRVIDSASAAGGQGLVALAAAAVARGGASADAVVAEARRVIAAVRVLGSVESLDHLVRSGRVPGLAARAAGRLRVRPLFELRDGKARARRPVRNEADIDRIVGWCLRDRPEGADHLHAVVMHTGAPERAAKLLAALEAEVEPVAVYVGPFGPAMVAHVGPGLLGLAWWWDGNGHA